MHHRFVFALLVLLGAAPARAQIGPDVVRMAPEEAFAAVERILAETEHLASDGVIVRADSALTAHLVGGLWLGPGNRVRVRADGVFMDFLANASLRLVSDGTRMIGGRSPEIGFDTTAAPALREALAVGLARMGLLHNLTRLFAGAPPERADGGVRDWVEVHDLAWLPESEVVGRPTRPLRFTVRVDGVDTAEAVLHLDAATGLPLRRTQTVAFPTGPLVVEERYTGWTVSPAEEGTFAVEPGPFEPLRFE
ncbi:MAG TPA: hypothetical protein VK002_09920 [Rubricoccaceae bacterium]|nr:hypothetical protein [Rubricoccaceae bacterium]